MITDEEINRRLGYHPATAETGPKHEQMREACIDLARHFTNVLPPGRETACALIALQEALMWANAAIACSPLGETSRLERC